MAASVLHRSRIGIDISMILESLDIEDHNITISQVGNKRSESSCSSPFKCVPRLAPRSYYEYAMCYGIPKYG